MSQFALIDLANVSILCVDDDPVIRSVVRSGLQRHGCKDFAQAHGGPEALDLCAGRDFDLLICDFQMSPMTGLDLLRELANAGHRASWPVIMLSAETDPATIQEAADLGVCAWVGKPISVQTLMERVGTVLGDRGRLNLSHQDPELRAAADRHQARLMAALRTAEETVRSLDFRPRDTTILAHGLRQTLDDIAELARTLDYGLVVMLAARATDVVAAILGNPAAAVRGHAATARALTMLVTAMKRVGHNRMSGDGAEAGLKLLEKIDGLIAPARAGLAREAGVA
jgi:two-component system chemotaxis response regulator CheY